MNRTSLAFTFIFIAACSHPAINAYEQASPENLKTFKTVSLPFGFGTHFFVSQGAFGKASHAEVGNEYSFDFDVPYGTPVLAVEEGKVIEVYEPKSTGGCDPKYSSIAHNIKVEHKDGSVAQYVHVQSEVHRNQFVHGGQVIAFTAENGWICQPQLHFGIYASKTQLYNSSNRKTIPVLFYGLPRGLAVQGLNYTVAAPSK